MEIWEPKPPGTLWATPGLLRDSFNLIRNVGLPSLVGFELYTYEDFAYCEVCCALMLKRCIQLEVQVLLSILGCGITVFLLVLNLRIYRLV